MENYKAIENDSEILFINKTWKKSNVIALKALPNFFPINNIVIYRTHIIIIILHYVINNYNN